MATIRAVMLVK